MRKALLSVLALAITTVGTAGPSQAAVTVDRESTIGKQIGIFFSVSKSVNCPGTGPSTAFANGFITAGESVSRTTGLPVTRSNGVTVDVFTSPTAVRSRPPMAAAGSPTACWDRALYSRWRR